MLNRSPSSPNAGLKVAIIAPEHPLSPRHGGIARYLRDYLPALATQACVHLVSIEPGEALSGIPQVIIPPCRWPSPLRPPHLSRRIVACLRGLAPDVVEYSNWLGLGCRDDGPWAKVVRISTPVRFGSLRPGLLPRLARPLHAHWERQTMRRMHLCISNSAANVQTCRLAYGALPPHVIVPHGIAARPEPRHPTSPDPLFVGRFEARKGLDVLLAAWHRMVARDQAGTAVLHLAGRDTPGRRGGSFLADCLAGLTIPGNRLAVHANPSDAELAALRRQCGIAVIPSRYESFGMVALEAFAAGQAVVAARAGGLAEVVDDGTTGLLFEPQSPEALADGLRLLIADPERRQSLVREARISLTERFSVEAMVRDSLAAYRSAIARQAPTVGTPSPPGSA